jgi:hypothetical protein
MADYRKPPSYEDLAARYDELLREWSLETPTSPHGAVSYLDLVSAIIAGQLTGRYEDEGGIVSSERDLGYALELLARAGRWLSNLDIDEVVEKVRAFFAAKDGEVQP